MNIYEKLAAVQQELKAPKDKKNTFAGYSYRSAEGILEAVKPVLKKYEAAITLSDEIVEIGGRIYVKATAKFFDVAKAETKITSIEMTFCGGISVTAYAREAEEKKGLDPSQITGTASSYARKYALNGLLLIDDTKDADTDEYQKQTTGKNEDAKIDADTRALIVKIAGEAKVDLKTILMKPLEELTNKQAGSLIQSLRKKIGG